MISKELLFMIIGANSLIFFCIYKDLEELYEKKKRDEQKKRNLLSDTIEFDVSVEEESILERLSRGNSKKYLREKIKELCKS